MSKTRYLVPVLMVWLTATASGTTFFVPSAEYPTLQDALAAASNGDEIWVAEGVYRPDEGAGQTPGDRDATFQLKNGVALYGGFPSGDSQWENRDPNIYITILSGDLAENDGPNFSNYDENSYTVVSSFYTDANTVFDGFTVTAGNSDDTYDWLEPRNSGGGLYCSGSSMSAINCTFSRNFAHAGGGIADVNQSDISLSDCTFNDNRVNSWGGGMLVAFSNSTLITCTFSSNSAIDGGAMKLFQSVDTIIGCIFADNTATSDGGGINNHVPDDEITKVINCVFTGNSAVDRGGGYFGGHCFAQFTNCTFISNHADDYGGGYCSGFNRGEPTFTNCIFWGNTAGDGPQLALSTSFVGFNVSINYCDIEGGEIDIYIDPLSTLLWGNGNINTDPLFADQPGGDYHLKSTAGRWYWRMGL